jgi:osmotically-inducible protein OsmY
VNKKDSRNLQISGSRENVEVQKVSKKLKELLEKRKIDGFAVRESGNTIRLTLPLMDEKERSRLITSLSEIPGWGMIKIDKPTTKTLVGDEEIEDAFREMISKYLPKESKVSGSSKNGILTIFGSVSSIHAREAVLDLAKECAGIKKVVDQTRVPSARSDIDLANSVMLSLGNEKKISIWHLQVVVKSGTVFLTGNAKDNTSVRLASDITEKVPGVRAIENGIRLQSEGVNPDDELKVKIIDEIKKSKDVRARDINPVVVCGNVFLKGYAATTREIIAAEALVSKIKGVKKVFMELEPKL